MGVVYGQFSSGRDINHSHMAPGHTSRYSFFLSLPTLHTNVRSLSLLFPQLATGCLYASYDISSSSRNRHTSGLKQRRPVVLLLAFVQISNFSKAPTSPKSSRTFYQIATRYSNLITGLDRPLWFQEFQAPRFQDSR